MLKALRTFFDQHLAPPSEETHADAERRAQLAAAVLLVEVARSDHTFSDSERESVLASVQRKFHLSEAEARQLLELAELESRAAHDIYQFTSQIDATFSLDEKLRLLEELWRAAYSDKVLHAYEEHLIRRVADLLHLSHSQFIRAKLRVLADSSSRN
ncbi:MAG TPA: TerB family tellurite resistance protein [Steroidobacteraceae bacterium]|jgi:uncharacterized tellurite resistance protein B-like protein|nr:TerB family tellurite resistance protein [Steroidobacteraceae bacterium]